MTFHNAIKYISSAPSDHGARYSYDRIRYLSFLLGDPHKRIKYLRLAGSNGKTICSAMISSVMVRSGYNVCTLNMSVLENVKENIRYNTLPISIEEFTSLIQTISSTCVTMKKNVTAAKASFSELGEISDEYKSIPLSLINEEISCEPTKSEILLLATLLFYKEKNCDMCIIESAHNSIDPSLFLNPPFAAVICGTIPNNDKRQISKIKTYIQKGISEVVSAPQDAYAYKVISDTCAAINCRLSVPVRSSLTVKQLSLIGTTFVYNDNEYKLSLCGRFQSINAITVIETVKLLRRCGYHISIDSEKTGMREVKIRSRFEVLSVNPTIIADSTYKSEAVETMCESLFDFSEITGRRIRLCLPCNYDLISNYLEMLSARGYTVTDIYTQSENEAEREEFESYISPELSPVAFETPKALSKHILLDMDQNDLLLISGKHSFTDKIRLEILRALEF